MRMRETMAALVVLALTLLLVISCRVKETTEPTKVTVTESTQAPEEATAVFEEPAEVPEEPTEQPMPTSVPVDYDVELYGNLENLDPSGQMIIYWHQHTNSREELLLSMIDEFNLTNEWNITAFAESQGGYDSLHQRITDGIQDNQLPSIAVAYQYRTATYAAQGALVALDPYVDSERWGYTEEELDDFFPVALSAGILPQFEARFGWPSHRSMEVLYYNKDWLAELGYIGPPETWVEFAEMACAAPEQPFSGATDPTPGYGYVYSVNASRLATFIFSRGGNMVNESGAGYVFNGPAGLEALTLWQDLVERGCAVEQTRRYGDQDFGASRSLFTIDSIVRLPDYKQAVSEGAGFEWSVAPPPHTTAEPRMNIYGASQSIFQTTPEQQLAAWLFIKWMSEPEQQAMWASSTGYFPTRQAAANLLADYFEENPTYTKAFTFMSMDYGIESPVTGYDECRAAIEEMLTAVLGGEDAQARLDMTVEQCNEYLEEAAP